LRTPDVRQSGLLRNKHEPATFLLYNLPETDRADCCEKSLKEQSMSISYHVSEHDGAWAYRLGDVWSETFPTHEEALAAAQNAAGRQQLGGQDADITYQRADGSWTTERSNGGDRPEAEVVDDAKE
jgi:hypothetical protein